MISNENKMTTSSLQSEKLSNIDYYIFKSKFTQNIKNLDLTTEQSMSEIEFAKYMGFTDKECEMMKILVNKIL